MSETIGTRVRQWSASSRVECVEIMPSAPFSYVPGHVVTLAAGETSPGYFAIGSAPSEGPALRFYLRPGGAAADSVLEAQDGDPIRIAGPIAHGFPLGPVTGKDLLFVGVGTGVAPLRSALVEALRDRAQYGRIVLVMGATDPQRCAAPRSSTPGERPASRSWRPWTRGDHHGPGRSASCKTSSAR